MFGAVVFCWMFVFNGEVGMLFLFGEGYLIYIIFHLFIHSFIHSMTY